MFELNINEDNAGFTYFEMKYSSHHTEILTFSLHSAEFPDHLKVCRKKLNDHYMTVPHTGIDLTSPTAICLNSPWRQHQFLWIWASILNVLKALTLVVLMMFHCQAKCNMRKCLSYMYMRASTERERLRSHMWPNTTKWVTWTNFSKLELLTWGTRAIAIMF
jgi:hypothetical protein